MGENASQKQGQKIELPLLFDYTYTLNFAPGDIQKHHKIVMNSIFDLFVC